VRINKDEEPMTQPDPIPLFNATDQPVTPAARTHLAYITRHWLAIATLAWDGYRPMNNSGTKTNAMEIFHNVDVSCL
jgi:hypothetical protein